MAFYKKMFYLLTYLLNEVHLY